MRAGCSGLLAPTDSSSCREAGLEWESWALAASGPGHSTLPNPEFGWNVRLEGSVGRFGCKPCRERLLLTPEAVAAAHARIYALGASFCTAGVSPPSQSGCFAVESKWEDVLNSSYFPAIATSFVLASSCAICSRSMG